MNCFFGTGNLTKDPVLRMTSSGKEVTTLSVAVRTSRKNKDGDYEAIFMNISVWGSFAVTCNNTLKKGDQITFKGELQQRTYTDKYGEQKTVFDINSEEVVFPQRSQNRSYGSNGYNKSSGSNGYTPHYLKDEYGDEDMQSVETGEDLPF